MSQLDPQALKLIGALKFDPGYLLLLDNLQARLDDLTDELSDAGLTVEQSQGKLQYWRAFREILQLLRVTPQAYHTAAKSEVIEQPSDFLENDWMRLARLANSTQPNE